MSLKSTRGRFSNESNEEKNSLRQQLDNVKRKSAISGIGRKPIIKKEEKKNNLDFDLSKINLSLKNLENLKSNKKNEEKAEKRNLEKNETNKNLDSKKFEKFNFESNLKSHFKESNIRERQRTLEKYDEKKSQFFEDEKYGYDFVEKKDKKSKVPQIIIMSVVEILTLGVIFAFGTFIRLTAVTPKSNTYNKTEVKNTNLSDVHLETMKGYKTVAIFGLDNRDDDTERGNADVVKIVHLNKETGELKIITVYRDLYVRIAGTSHYGKLNSSYAGGATRAIKTLNENLDLNITDYLALNWKAVAMGIDFIGGVDLEVSRSEYKYFNAFVHEVCRATGIDKTNPAAHYIKSSGYQHLDGVQAVAYARLRLTDSDFQRVERQNKVMSLAFEKVKQLSVNEILSIAGVILQEISYEFDWTEMISLIPTIVNINITTPYECPELTNIVTQYMGSSGDCVVPNTLETAVKKLHKEMYGDENYQVSSAVKSYSNRITELRHQYKEENDKRLAESLSESNENGETTSATKETTKRSNSSNSKETKSTNENGENLPIIDETYPEEPEEDETTTRVEVVNTPTGSRETTTSNSSNTGVGVAPGENSNVVVTPGTTVSAPGQSTTSPGISNSGPISAPNIESPTATTQLSTEAVVVAGPPG